jgi:hypothetical protein
VESKVAAEALPAAISKAILEKAKGAQILGVEKEDVFMEPQLVKLAQPKTTYEVKVTLEGKTYEMVVDGAGTVLKMNAVEDNKEEKGKKEGNKEEKEGDDDEQVIALDKLPDAVKTAIINASEGGTVKKVISEQENGKTTYEAEAVIGGQEFEIKVDADGKVLEKKAEQDGDKDKKSGDKNGEKEKKN